MLLLDAAIIHDYHRQMPTLIAPPSIAGCRNHHSLPPSLSNAYVRYERLSTAVGEEETNLSRLTPWDHCCLTKGAQGGVALATSDREGVDATCQSVMVPWAIERAERAQW